MTFIENIIRETDLTFSVIVFRLLLSFFLGGLIGVERERHNQPAGFRTHMLISIGATMLMLLSIHVPRMISTTAPAGYPAGDPGRIAAQVVSGIGFLGAGAILKLGVNIRGVTTAASIWVVAALGLLIGAGMYATSAISTAIILFILTVLDVVEEKVFTSKFLRSINIYLRSREIRTAEILPIITKFGVEIKNTDISQSFDEAITKIRIVVKIPEHLDIEELFGELRRIPDIYKISLKREV